MRTLVLISADLYVRNFVETGAFSALDASDTWYVASGGRAARPETQARLELLPTYLGTVEDPRPRADDRYRRLRKLYMAAAGSRSRTMRHKLSLLPPLDRTLYTLAAVPGIRQVLRRTMLRRAGLNPELHSLIERLRPDLLVTPSGGFDTLVWDGLRSGRALGIPSLMLTHNWDNLSSKGLFPVTPDYLGVWGEQSIEHARRIHGFPADRVTALGAPSFEQYFHPRPGSTASPFPFRYALFAGCFAPFDEAAALRRLDRAIEAAGADITVVYRPHPHRMPRKMPDYFDEREFSHVVLDPQVRDHYGDSFKEQAGWASSDRRRLKPLLPPLDYYPALLAHAELVVCPLSTMIVEAALFERPVIVIAYDDGIHANSPAAVIEYEHFEGIDRVDGFHLARRPEDLDEAFLRVAEGGGRPTRPLRDQIRRWLHFDERSYGERLRDWIEVIGRREGISTPVQHRPAPRATRTS
ncbi:MAG: hypothetical protein WKF96_14640 [Solirubrobacteraceae bacterium]